MSERTFDRETLLDLTVNVIPLGIILFFVVLFLVVRPWEQNLFLTAVSMALLVVPFVALAVLTYFSGRAIAGAEQADAEAAATDPSTADSGSTGASADLADGVTAETADDETTDDRDADEPEPAVTDADSE